MVDEKTHEEEPRSFKNVKLFIGDNIVPPALVKLRNISYGKNENLSQSIPNFAEITPKHDYLLDKIQSWGHTYSVTFDLKLNQFIYA